ncbi:S-adenosyl-L-methionine-dependent methyltransferase [Xylariaceae sp. FL1651]|nr:S-adenosyl-L-methionine-dependent methyltransferase [Xylariaceae sp. FL1651]
MAKDSVYILNDPTKDGAQKERARLDFQHHYISDTMQNELLPSHIMNELTANPSPRVCDMATGSAIWLRELAKALPTSAELVGLDFDSSKFPDAEELLPNIKLGFADIFEPFPEELRNRFDVVHVRFLVFVLKKGQGVALVQNLLSLLRPGGWLVWVELSATLASTEPPSEAFFQFQKIHYDFATRVGLDLDLPLVISSYLREAGLVDCDDRSYNCNSQLYGPKKPDWLSRGHHEMYESVRQILKGILIKGGADGMKTEQELEELLARLKKEISGTRKLHLSTVRAWGRKRS